MPRTMQALFVISVCGTAGLCLPTCASTPVGEAEQPILLETSQIVGGTIGQSSAGNPGVWPPLGQIPAQAQEDADGGPGWAWTPPLGRPLPPNTVSLTFDDGPAAHTLDVATYLASRGIRATFFAVGCHFGSARGGPLCQSPSDLSWSTSILTQLVSLGHRVGNHTEYHCELTGRESDAWPCSSSGEPRAPDTLVSWLSTTQQRFDPFMKDDGMYLFRAPTNGWNAQVADAVRNDAELSKLTGPFAYDSYAGDWFCTQTTPERSIDDCAQDYLDCLPPTTKAGILQLHDRNPNDPQGDYTLRLVQCLVGGQTAECAQAKLSGFRFVPLDAIPGVRGDKSFLPAPPSFPTVFSDFFSDANGWNQSAGYYGTLRLADLDGDHVGDVCGRKADGVFCALSQQGSMGSARSYLPSLSDANGWGPPQYGTTLQLGDVDGDGLADLCIRGVWGLYCYKGHGTSFDQAVTWYAPDFADGTIDDQPHPNGASTDWSSSESYYGSIHLGDINHDGKADVCGRGVNGIYCAIAMRPDLCPTTYASGFCPGRYWYSSDFRDSTGWAPSEYGSTVQLADVDGDGRADVCGRGIWGVVCALSDGSQFGDKRVWSPSAFTDSDMWNTPTWNGVPTRWYKTIHFADIDGDGMADVCGRSATGVECAVSDGKAFTHYRYVYNHDFLDSTGWSPPEYGTTLMLGDVDGNGRADVCGRGKWGLVCATAPNPPSNQ